MIKQRTSQGSKLPPTGSRGGMGSSTLPPRSEEYMAMQQQRQAMEAQMKEAEKLMTGYKVTTWGNNFPHQPLETKDLNSIFLKDNSDFNDCITMINEYNAEIIECKEKQKEVKNGPWRSKFYNNLLALLRQVMFTRNRLLQQKFATKVHTWAEEQLMKEEINNQEQKRSTSTSQAPGNQSMSVAGGGTGSGDQKNLLDQSIGGAGNTSSGAIRPVSAAFNNSTTFIMRGESADPKHHHLNITSTTRPESGLYRPESGIIRPDSAFNKTDGDIVKQVRFQSDQPHVPQPSEIIEQVLKDYKNGHRTRHPDCDPPADRIKDYKRRVLSFDDPTTILKQPALQKLDNEPKFKYPKPIIQKHEPLIQEPHTQRKQDEVAAAAAAAAATAAAAAGTTTAPPGSQPVIGPDGTVVPPPVVLGPDGQPIPQPPVVLGPDGQPIPQPPVDGAPIEEEVEGGQEGEDGEGPPPEAMQIPPEEIEKGILMPDVKPYVRDDYGEDTFKRDLNQQFQVRSTYLYYEPSDDPREIAMEQKWLNNRNKEIADKRQEEQMIQHIKEWTQAQGKLNQQISRQIDSAIYGSQFHLCEYKPKNKYTAKDLEQMDRRRIVERAKEKGPDESIIVPVVSTMTADEKQNLNKQIDESGIQKDDDQEDIEELNEVIGDNTRHRGGAGQDDSFMQDLQRANFVDHSSILPSIAQPQLATKPRIFSGIEHNMNKKKIAIARKMHGELIGLSKKPTEQENSHLTMLPSLSLYSQPRPNAMRPFSAVFEKASPEIIQQEQLEEIEEIKNRMAKYKINVPIQQIMDSILVPDGIDPDQDGQLPEPGYGLMENPFFKLGKQKKKKKGKKGKKGKK